MILAAAWLLACAPQQAVLERGEPLDPVQDVGLDQRLGAQVPLDLVFRDTNGTEAPLGAWFGERPVVLALVYHRCPMLCNLVLNGLVDVLRTLRLEAGEDFELVVVSIDPSESPELAAEKRAHYLDALGDGDEGDDERGAGWNFLVGDQQAIEELAAAVGFRYVYDPRTDEYAHASGLVVATPDGVLSRYLYGVEYADRELRLALVEAADGEVGSFVDRLLLLCYHYDPTTGRYGFAIMSVLRFFGIVTVVAIVTFVLRSMRSDRRARVAPIESGGV